jgi:NAD(P)-dependent dehydrogenase (short-subunit alcohol dehydrogenase family)
MPTILVTGANRGLGLEFVRQYAADGARVLAACRTPVRADALVSIAAGSQGRVTVHPLDVTEEGSVAGFKSVLGAQALDIVIANAGTYGGSRQGWDDMDFDAWARTLAVNLMAPLRLAQIVHRNLLAGDEKKFIAITSSMGSNDSQGGGMHGYRTSKAALNKLVSTLAQDWRADGLIAVPISPGWVKTDMGGAQAPLSPAQSIGAMRKVIAGLTLKQSGRLVDYDGAPMGW